MTTISKKLVHENELHRKIITSTKQEITHRNLNEVISSKYTLSFLALIYVCLLFSTGNLFANDGNDRYHRVEEGETIQYIARKYGITVDELKEKNNLYSGTIHEGQLILISSNSPRVIANSHNARASKLNGFTKMGSESTSSPAVPFDPAHPYSTVKSIKQERRATPTKPAFTQNNNAVVAQDQSSFISNSPSSSKLQKLPGLRTETTFTSEALNKINDAREMFRVEQEAVDQPWYSLYFRDTKIVRFRDNVQSAYAVRADGIIYNGGTIVNEELINSLGYDAKVAYPLAFVSSNEGGVSDINSYDKALLSFGFIQFTLRYGALEKFLAIVKNNNPSVFQASLVKYGFDLETSTDKYGKTKNTLVVYAPEGFKGKTKLSGADLADYLLVNKRLFGPLILLGEQTKKEQVQAAYEMYYDVATNINLTIPGIQQQIIAGEMLNTKAGLAALTDLCVKLGPTGAKNQLEATTAKIVNENNIKNYDDLANFDELDFIQFLINTTSNDLVKRRMNKLLAENQTVMIGR